MRDTLRRSLPVVVMLAMSAGCREDPQKAARQHEQAGDQYVAKGQYVEAVVEYKNVIQVQPRNGPVRVKLSDTYVKLDDLANAYQQAVTAADLLPNDQGVQLKAGKFLLMAGRFEDAKTIATNLLQKDLANVDAQIL